jgi:hypothetical protein
MIKQLEKLKKLSNKKESIENKIDEIKSILSNSIIPKVVLIKKIQNDLIDESNKKNDLKLPIRTDRYSLKNTSPKLIGYIPDHVEDFRIDGDNIIIIGSKYFCGGDEYISIEMPKEYIEMSIDQIEQGYSKKFQDEIDNILDVENKKLLENKKKQYEILKKQLEEMEIENNKNK